MPQVTAPVASSTVDTTYNTTTVNNPSGFGPPQTFAGGPAATPEPVPPGLPTYNPQLGQNVAPGTYALPNGLGTITIAYDGTSQVTPAPNLTPDQTSQLQTYDYLTFNNAASSTSVDANGNVTYGAGGAPFTQNRPTGLNPATDAPYTWQDYQDAVQSGASFTGLVEMPNGSIQMMGAGGPGVTGTAGAPPATNPADWQNGHYVGSGSSPDGNAAPGLNPANVSPPGATGGATAPAGGGATLTRDAQGNQVLTSTVGGVTTSLSFSTASQIINSALQVVGLDPNALATSGINQGQTLTQYFWNQIVGQGITDETTVGEMIQTLLPSTGQFETAFPGYQAALKAGYVRTVAEYVQSEEGITAVMLQGGVPKDLINPTTVGDLIAKGVSVNEVAARVQNGLDQALNAPAEVQNYFAQEFGANNSAQALATVFLNPDINDVTLQKMLAGAQIRGAFAASNLTVSQGLSQRLADMGQTYASAQQAAKALNQQRGLFEQTVGEQQSQAPVPGTLNQNRPLDINDQGVQAAIGTNAADEQQVHQVALARQNDFRGGGGASTTQAEGFSGLSEAKPF